MKSSHLQDAFAAGWMLLDTNGDGIIDAVGGKVVVAAEPTASANTAASEIAARIGFLTTGITPPLVITAPEDQNNGPRIWVGANAAPAKYAAEIATLMNRLQQDEGGVFELDGSLIVLGQNDAGLLAAGSSFAAHAPYLWKAPGEKLTAIGELVGLGAALSGVTYQSGFSGIHRAFLRTDSAVGAMALETALKSARLDQVHELVVTGNGGASVSFASEKPLPASPAAPASVTASVTAPAPTDAAAEAAPNGSIWQRFTPCVGCSAVLQRCQSLRIWIRNCTFQRGRPGLKWRTLRLAMGMRQRESRCLWRSPLWEPRCAKFAQNR